MNCFYGESGGIRGHSRSLLRVLRRAAGDARPRGDWPVVSCDVPALERVGARVERQNDRPQGGPTVVMGVSSVVVMLPRASVALETLIVVAGVVAYDGTFNAVKVAKVVVVFLLIRRLLAHKVMA